MCTIAFTTPSRKSRSCEITSSVPGIALEPVLEPDDGVEVEVVGRLVEQQQLRRAHQRLREVQPHAPAAGEARDRALQLFVPEAQADEQASRRASARCRRRHRRAPRAARRSACRRWRPPRAAPRGRAARCRRRSRIRPPGARAPASPAPRARCASGAGKSTSPLSACSSPRSSAKGSILPEPFAPIRPTRSPGLRAASAPSSRSFAPRRSDTFEKRITDRKKRRL